MINADRIIASLIMISALYFMWHAVSLPIGWNGEVEDPTDDLALVIGGTHRRGP